MSNDYVDPSGNTEAFRSFQQSPEPAEATSSKMPLIIGLAVGAVVLIALGAFLLAG
jgi:hypothetical protein